MSISQSRTKEEIRVLQKSYDKERNQIILLQIKDIETRFHIKIHYADRYLSDNFLSLLKKKAQINNPTQDQRIDLMRFLSNSFMKCEDLTEKVSS